MTRVRYFPRSALVMIRGRGITTTFQVTDRGSINPMLDWLGYRRVYSWQSDGANLTAYTERLRSQAAA